MKGKKFTKFEITLFIFLAAILVLIIPHIIRYLFLGDVLIGEESYYHARIASEINKHGIPVSDRLSYGGIDYIFNPYHVFLAFFSSFLGAGLASKLIPFVLGILSIFLFYHILKNLGLNFEMRFISTIILLFSPPFIYNFVVSTYYSLLIFLVLLTFALFISKNNYLFLASLFLMLLIPLFGFFHVFVFAFLLFSYMFYKKKTVNRFFICIIFLLLSSLYSYATIYSRFFKSKVLSKHIFGELVSGLGSEHGLLIFVILLALVGIVALWKYKKDFYPIYMNSLVLIIAFLFKGNQANIYLSIFFSVFAGLGFYTLMKMKWELRIIKNLTLWLLIVALLFSSALYIARLVNFEPNKDTIHGLEWLKDKPKALVFSHHSKGFWIEYNAEMPVFIDSLFNHKMDSDKRLNISDNIFYSRDLRKTRALLKENKIGYIWIDEKMRHGQVWEEQEQGLLFLFKNNETFKNIYANSGVEIWEFSQEE